MPPTYIEPTIKNIIVIDNQPIVRFGISAILNHESYLDVCCEASSVEEAMAQMSNKANALDLAIVDLSLALDLSIFRKLKAIQPNLRILVFSWHDERVYAEKVIKAGGHGYLMKSESATMLLGAVNHLLQGEIFVSDNIRNGLLNSFMGQSPAHVPENTNRFTDAELIILELLASGKTRSEISSYLNRSAKTFDAHCTNIKRKMNIPNNRVLMQFAVQSTNRC